MRKTATTMSTEAESWETKLGSMDEGTNQELLYDPFSPIDVSMTTPKATVDTKTEKLVKNIANLCLQCGRNICSQGSF